MTTDHPFGPSLTVHRVADRTELAAAAADFIVQAAHAAIERSQSFRLVLAGGSTPGDVYQLLAQRRATDHRWQLYLGDERCLPDGHAERNSTMVAEAWPQNTRPNATFLPMRAELGAAAGAADYAPQIRDAVPFDLVVLGMGEDGHTASLFPGLDTQANTSGETPEQTLVVPVNSAPKPPPQRISLSRQALRATAAQLILVSGAAKRTALARWRDGGDLPIAAVTRDMAGTLLVTDDAWPDTTA